MPAPYATREDLTAFLAGGDYADQLPADDPDGDAALARLLTRAWEVIDDATASMYELDEDVPTWVDPDDSTNTVDVTDVLTNAVCAQVEQWFEVGEDNDIAGLCRDKSVSWAGISLAELPSILAPRAARYLRRGLILATTPPTDAPIGVVLI